MKFLHAITFAAAALCAPALAAPAGPVKSISSVPTRAEASAHRSIKVNTAATSLLITPVNDDIFRITTLPHTAPVTLPESQSAVLAPTLSATDLKVTSSSRAVTLSSATTTLSIDRATGHISFFNNKGDLLLSEAPGVDNTDPSRRTVTFAYPEGGDIFYGGGERGHSLTINGDTLEMYNRQNYGYTGTDPRIRQMGITVPCFVSSRGYGVLFDDHTKSTLIMGDPIQYISPAATGPLSYYFINGSGTMAGVTSAYTALTGRQSLPPFWALGYITSRYGYHDRAEALAVIDSLKRGGYPLDGIVLDLYWYGVETDMGKLAWDTLKWPDHKGMLADLKQQGINLVAITQPYINKKGAIDNYNYLTSRGMTVRDSEGANHDVTTWVGDAGMFDVSNPDTRLWYWNRYRDLTREGIAGWWGDLGEPEVHPSTIRHHNGMTAEQYHNVYGNEWSRIIYEGLRREFPDTRPLLMMRGGTAGLQRYSVFPWTTDVSRSWGGFQPQVKLMLSSGLSGLGYMSSDIGGFAVDPEHPVDPELYLRWLQMGVFTPMLRTHAQLMPEPYHYPGIEPIARAFIKKRYEWLPYNYTLAYENAAKGWPLARPLDFRGDNPDPKYAAIDDEYLWGDDILVAPVMKAGAHSRRVTFPSGEWVDFDNPSLVYKGGTVATVKAPLDKLPLFVRSGAFIPQYTLPLDNVTRYDPAHLTVRYFPSSRLTQYTLFDDDRRSPGSLSDGDYMLTVFSGRSDKTDGTHIEISSESDPSLLDWMPSVRNITLVIERQAKAPHFILASSGGHTETLPRDAWTYSPARRTLTIHTHYRGGTLALDIK